MVMVVVLIYAGHGGFGYLRQWKWWAGLILSKLSVFSFVIYEIAMVIIIVIIN